MKNNDETAHLSDEHIDVGVKILNTSSRLLLFLSNILKPSKLTFQQYNVLRILIEADTPVSIKFIGSKMIDPNSNTSRLVDKLVEKDFAQRLDLSSDKRIVNVAITEKGAVLANNARVLIETQFKDKIGVFSNEDMVQLHSILDRLNEII